MRTSTFILATVRALLLVAVTSVPMAAFAQTGPTSVVLDINSRLAATYRGMLADDQMGKAIALDKLTILLSAEVGRLYVANSAIRGLGGGTGDDELRAAAYRYRAAAWLHGWAIFSRLVIEAGRTDRDPEIRKQLINLNTQNPTSSALGSLLAVYKQIQEEEGSDQPLRHLLRDGTNLVFLLAYEEDWRGEKPSDIAHRYYIPSSDALFGTPSDTPSLDRHIISMWGTINCQLDTFHQFDIEQVRADSMETLKNAPLAFSRASGALGWLRSNEMNLEPLRQWLDSLQHNEDLSAFSDRNSGLKSRLQKIQLYLQARQNLSDPAKLKVVIRGLSDSRIQNTDPRSVIGDLIEAAAPLSVSGGQPEVLDDAAIWLRYLMLASYQNEGRWVVSDAANSLEKTWETYRLPGKFSLAEPELSPGSLASLVFLRWNKWPPRGSLSELLNNLTKAAYEYLKFEEGRWDRDKLRFASLRSAESRKQYADALERATLRLSANAESRLLRYFSASDHQQSAAGSGTFVLAEIGNPLARSFRGTSTIEEQARIAHDSEMIYAQVKDEIVSSRLVLEAYRTGDPTALAVSLRTWNGDCSLCQRGFYQLPSFPFAKYAEQLAKASDALSNVSNQISIDQDLRGIFGERQIEYQRARDDLEAANLGVTIAGQANVISKTFVKIAQLQAEADKLERAAAELRYKGAATDQKAKALALQYAIQQRELAAAKVEALLAASEQATQLVDQASTELAALKQRLLSTSAAIHDQKEQQRNRSFINGVINIVGLALAPFTSGASLQIATQVTQAINLIDQVKHTDWSNLNSAVATLDNVGSFATQTLDLAAKYAGPDLTKGITDVKVFLNSAKTTINDYSAQAQKVYGVIRGLSNLQDREMFASAIASGIPLFYDETKQQLRLNLDTKQLIPANRALQDKLTVLLDAGEIMVNDARIRSEKLAALPGLVGQELRTELKNAVELTFREMPPDLLKQPDLLKSREAIKEAKDGLKNVLDEISDDDAKMLAEAWASGAVFVKDITNRVVAIQAATGPEIKAFQTRLRAYQNAISTNAVTDLVQNIEKTKDQIDSAAQKYVAQQDDGGLATYANTVLPQKIDDIRQQLDKLKNSIDGARGELEDKKTLFSIASYGSEAADYYTEAARTGVDAASVRASRADLAVDGAVMDVKKVSLISAQQDKLSLAATRSVEIAAASLRRTYFECLARGFDPMSSSAAEKDTETATQSPFEGLSLSGVTLGSIDNKSDRERILLQNQADAVAGMVLWVTLLELVPSGTIGNNPVEYRLGLYSRLLELERKKDWKGIDTLGRQLATVFDDKAADALEVNQAKAEHLGKSDIIWFDEMSTGEYQYWASRVRNPNLQRHLLGVIRLEFSTTNGPYDKLIYRPPDPTDPKLGFAYYMSPKDAVVSPEGTVLDASQLTFVVIAPSQSFVNLNDAISDRATADPGTARQFSSPDEAQWLKGIQISLARWKQLNLTAAIGHWVILLASSADMSDAERQSLRAELKIAIRLPFVRVTRNASGDAALRQGVNEIPPSELQHREIAQHF